MKTFKTCLASPIVIFNAIACVILRTIKLTILAFKTFFGLFVIMWVFRASWAFFPIENRGLLWTLKTFLLLFIIDIVYRTGKTLFNTLIEIVWERTLNTLSNTFKGMIWWALACHCFLIIHFALFTFLALVNFFVVHLIIWALCTNLTIEIWFIIRAINAFHFILIIKLLFWTWLTLHPWMIPEFGKLALNTFVSIPILIFFILTFTFFWLEIKNCSIFTLNTFAIWFIFILRTKWTFPRL